MHVREVVTSLIGGSLLSGAGFMAQVAQDVPQVLGVGAAFGILLIFTLRSYDKLQTRAAEEASRNAAQQLETIRAQMVAQEKLSSVIADNTIAKRELLAGFQEVKLVLQQTLAGNVMRDRNEADHPHPTHLG